MKTFLTTSLALLMLITSNAQVKLRNNSLSLDVGRPMQTWLDNEKGFAVTAGTEHSLNDVFSIETMYTYDQDNYLAFSRDFGLGAAEVSPYEPWSNQYQEGYVGLRIYPEENYHSQALSLRNKKNYGWYFSFGYGAYSYKRANYNLEHYTHNEYIDTLGQTVVFHDSAFVHRHGYTIKNSGVQFGFGWKQYHNKFYYTELGVQSSAYVRQARSTSFWKEEDPRRNQATPYYQDDIWENYTDHIGFFSKNGRGFILRFNIGINLDFRR